LHCQQTYHRCHLCSPWSGSENTGKFLNQVNTCNYCKVRFLIVPTWWSWWITLHIWKL
jgi:hypothetical protein